MQNATPVLRLCVENATTRPYENKKCKKRLNNRQHDSAVVDRCVRFNQSMSRDTISSFTLFLTPHSVFPSRPCRHWLSEKGTFRMICTACCFVPDPRRSKKKGEMENGRTGQNRCKKERRVFEKQRIIFVPFPTPHLTRSIDSFMSCLLHTQTDTARQVLHGALRIVLPSYDVQKTKFSARVMCPPTSTGTYDVERKRGNETWSTEYKEITVIFLILYLICACSWEAHVQGQNKKTNAPGMRIQGDSSCSCSCCCLIKGDEKIFVLFRACINKQSDAAAVTFRKVAGCMTLSLHRRQHMPVLFLDVYT